MEVLSPQSIFMQIVVTAARLEGVACQRFFAPLGLSSTTFKILHTLSEHPSMNPTQITKTFDCTKSNLTQRLNLLEKNGFVLRIRSSKGDGRTVRIALTDSGQRKVTEAVRAIRQSGALLEKHFSDVEKKSCHDFLKKVNQILDPYEHTSPCRHR